MPRRVHERVIYDALGNLWEWVAPGQIRIPRLFRGCLDILWQAATYHHRIA